VSGQTHQFLAQSVINLGAGGNSHELYHDPLQTLARLHWQAISAIAHLASLEAKEFGARQSVSAR
jgi:hypothetical protein